MNEDLEILAAVGLERGELRLDQARQAEAAARAIIVEARSHAPANDDEREQYRAKATQFRSMVEGMLESLSAACSKVPELVTRLDELNASTQVTVLGKYLGTILEGEAATAKALAVTLEACQEIDAAIERSI